MNEVYNVEGLVEGMDRATEVQADGIREKPVETMSILATALMVCKTGGDRGLTMVLVARPDIAGILLSFSAAYVANVLGKEQFSALLEMESRKAVARMEGK